MKTGIGCMNPSLAPRAAPRTSCGLVRRPLPTTHPAAWYVAHGYIPGGLIVVLGTPAEEGGGGKLGMIQQGVFDDVTCALMAHPAPDNKFDCDGDIFSAATMVKVAFKGKSSHAAAAPYDGVNALDAAVMAYNSISCMRQQLRPSYRVAATSGGYFASHCSPGITQPVGKDLGPFRASKTERRRSVDVRKIGSRIPTWSGPRGPS
ncbi:hypothetical protein CAPTEDRAFT_213237 [Capitella teleta]|uniref:Peptidase M20 dimerisation domain-containing protein n=1 Tax=Capitella teleta TaxID=283909 RepID=R7UWM0_CAPTE|nr:hypothetical protein CAPTEDRAFT_213237 [Capitella teleta]|eukprot:ELU08337.1 hypothetical protein CAPTEDRAFT_213237 [Capitella teleta]